MAKVRKGGPADRAGLRGVRVVKEVRRQGSFYIERERPDYDYADEILAIDGQPVTTHSEFLDLMDRYTPGQKIMLTILREGQRRRVEMTLGES